jgi:hypothetical protein
MKILRAISIVAMLVVVGVLVSARFRTTASLGVPHSKTVRIVSLESVLNLDGSSTIRSVNIRWITEAGAWKLIKLDAQGKKSMALYSEAGGLFAEGKDHSSRIRDENLSYLSTTLAREYDDPQFLNDRPTATSYRLAPLN